jgi:hypothetical protein
MVEGIETGVIGETTNTDIKVSKQTFLCRFHQEYPADIVPSHRLARLKMLHEVCACKNCKIIANIFIIRVYFEMSKLHKSLFIVFTADRHLCFLGPHMRIQLVHGGQNPLECSEMHC